MEKRTPLYERHLAAGGKMVPFAGFLMPVQYSAGVITEHLAVRNAAGLFDVSHMGELWLRGEGCLAFLQELLTNDMAGMKNGDCRYSPMCNEAGGVVDDLIVYCLDESTYMLVVNAANHDKDLEWISGHLFGDVQLEDRSDETALIALQGPQAEMVLSPLAGEGLPARNYSFVDGISVEGIRCLISRTGYTGEDGFELYCDAPDAPALWDTLLAAGAENGLIPCGLGARDTLRLEAAMPLYGHEMDDTVSPLEAGLGYFVKMDKASFIGKEALEKMNPPARRRAGLKMVDRGIAREGSEVYLGGEKIGVVTSGTQLPFLGYAGAMALLDAEKREIGAVVEVDVRGRRLAAEIVKLPFYKRSK